MKNSTRTFLYIALAYFLFFLLFTSCSRYETIHQSLCDGTCDTQYEVIYKGQSISPNPNGFYEIQWDGLNYFQIEGQLSELNDQYVINGVPLIEANFDSDYWIVMDSIRFQTPMYSYLGWFNNNTLSTPIPFGTYTYTMNDLIDLHPPLNAVGYQIPQNFCIDCPYASTLIGTHSRYNYNPKQNIMLDNEMVGDTINIFIETIFNTEGGVTYHGHTNPVPQEIVENQIKVIII